MNLPYCISVTLIDGDAFVEQFSSERIKKGDVMALSKRVEVVHEPAFDTLGPSGRHKVSVKMFLRDGTTLEETVDYAKGSDKDPLTDQEVVTKFFRITSPIYGQTWSDATCDAIMSIQCAATTAGLSKLLSTPFLNRKSNQKATIHA
jgi:2-methylcitrate dehydratase PrpD